MTPIRAKTGRPRRGPVEVWRSFSRVGRLLVQIAVILGGVGGLLAGLAAVRVIGGSPKAAVTAPTSPRTHGSKGLHFRIPNHGGRFEIADNAQGVAVYATAATPNPSGSLIKLGTRVLVRCWIPNFSGIRSINRFYALDTAPWKHKLASANEFANGAKVGVSTAAHSVDPRIHECPHTTTKG